MMQEEKVEKAKPRLCCGIAERAIESLQTAQSWHEVFQWLTRELRKQLDVEQVLWIPGPAFAWEVQESVLQGKGDDRQQSGVPYIAAIPSDYHPDEAIPPTTLLPESFFSGLDAIITLSDLSQQSNQEQLAWLEELQFRSAILIPVAYGATHQFGVFIGGFHQQSAQWSTQDITSLERCMAQISTALYLDLQHRDTRTALERERLLFGIGRLISQTFDIHNILQSAAREVGRYFQADRCLILRYNLENTEIPVRLYGQYCASSDIQAIPLQDLPFSTIRRSIETLVLDYSTHENAQDELEGYRKKYNIQSYLSMQITYRGLPLGMIDLHQCRTSRTWQKQEVELLTTVATQIGAALYQAELYNQEQLAKEEAKAANLRKNQYIASMTHDLRTPLHNIIAGSAMVKTKMLGPLTEKQTEYIGLINKSGEHLLQIINDLLDIARIEAGRFSVAREEVRPKELLEQALLIMGPCLREKKQKWALTMAEGLPEAIPGDALRLTQVLCNLLSNAQKFTPEEKLIELSCFIEDDLLVFSVRDEGRGIDQADLNIIFQPFEQGSPYNAHGKPQGSGLGLAIAKTIVELHGGTIRVISEPNQGSDFRVYLPKHGASKSRQG